MNKMKFPYAPMGWTPDYAKKRAAEEDIELDEDHWCVIQSLQEYFSKNEHEINIRELTSALDERFHEQGGQQYLFKIFPQGPVAQGCKLAGLQVPPNVIDKSFGSVF
jgi:tRNA 2-thiouridine synthesizing protein E